VGVESRLLGTEVPRAYIVRKASQPGSSSSNDAKQQAQEIISWLNSRVANHKKLRGGVKFVDSVPKSVSGKILRRVLKDVAKKEFAQEEDEIEKNGIVKAKL
jgi:4-coumarate--CoA ligase